ECREIHTRTTGLKKSQFARGVVIVTECAVGVGRGKRAGRNITALNRAGQIQLGVGNGGGARNVGIRDSAVKDLRARHRVRSYGRVRVGASQVAACCSAWRQTRRSTAQFAVANAVCDLGIGYAASTRG